jgi:hypothetical protein
MKIVIGLCSWLLVWSLGSFAQAPVTTTTAASSVTQAIQLLQQALTALSPNISTRDITMSGTVHHISGSIDENGASRPVMS